MSISLKDIAIAIGVSKTTVSWVLSGRGDEKKISMQMQEKVQAYARTHNYRPNLLAKSLNSGISNTIGLIVPSIADEFYAQIARQVELEAEKYGYTVTFCSSEADPVRETRLIQMLKARQVDGLIIAATKYSKDEIEILKEEAFPFVLIDRFFPELDANYVIVDNRGGTYQVVKRLIAAGHRKIAFLTTDTHLLVMQMRYDGYCQALEEASIPIDSAIVINVARSDYENDIIVKLDMLFRQNPDIDAFFFATHYLGLESLRYLYKYAPARICEMGLGCFHGSPSFSILAPEMLIIRQPIEMIGKRSVEILIKSIQDESPGICSEVLEMTMAE